MAVGSLCNTRLALVVALALVALAWPMIVLAQDGPIFREPFTLKLYVDQQRTYEQRFEKAPYFVDSTVFLFAGDHLGINVVIEGNQIASISYQKDVGKADVIFKLTQQRSPNGDGEMLMVVQNKLKRPVLYDALMTVPGQKGIYKTSIVPVRAGLGSYEHWPHPIVQLVLRNFRFVE